MVHFGFRTPLLVASAALGMIGCANPFSNTDDCTLIGYPSLRVVVTDAVSAGPVSTLVTVRATRGAETFESRRPSASSNPSYYTVGMGAGTFRVVVSAEGYTDAVRENVRVDSDRCGAEKTVQLTIPLQRAP